MNTPTMVVSITRASVVFGLLTVSAVGLVSQSAGPQPTPMPPPIVAAKDVPYPGIIRLAVDASDLERRLSRLGV